MFSTNIKAIFLVATPLIIAGCANPSHPDNPVNAALLRSIPDSSSSERIKTAKENDRRERVAQSINKAPDWFLSDSANEDTVYVTSTESALDMQLSIDMAMLSAKRLLTNSLGEYISSRMTEFAGQTANSEGDPIMDKEVERVTKSTVTEVLLKGYQRDRILVVTNGPEFQTFVRLKYPTAELKRLMAAEISKNAVMVAKVRKTKAFEDLEKEIESARAARTGNTASADTK